MAQGYLTLALQGTDGALATIRRIDINSFGDQPPLTAAQRRDDIQRWAQAQMREDGENARTTEDVRPGGDCGRAWGYNTAIDVAPPRSFAPAKK